MTWTRRNFFIVLSKTFTTLETMTNAQTSRDWLLKGLGGDVKAVAKHFVAVSTNTAKVSSSVLTLANMFEFWDWVGGATPWTLRSVCPQCWLWGRTTSAPCSERLPPDGRALSKGPVRAQPAVLMALLALWYNNFFGAQSVAVLPYEQYLEAIPCVPSAVDMESNGKRVTLEGAEVDYQTGAIYWGNRN